MRSGGHIPLDRQGEIVEKVQREPGFRNSRKPVAAVAAVGAVEIDVADAPAWSE